MISEGILKKHFCMQNLQQNRWVRDNQTRRIHQHNLFVHHSATIYGHNEVDFGTEIQWRSHMLYYNTFHLSNPSNPVPHRKILTGECTFRWNKSTLIQNNCDSVDPSNPTHLSYRHNRCHSHNASDLKWVYTIEY